MPDTHDNDAPSTPTVGGEAESHHHHHWWSVRRHRHADRRAHKEAARVEKGLPEALRGGEDLEGQERLKRASLLLRVKNEFIAVSATEKS